MKRLLFVLIILIPMNSLFSQINREEIGIDLRYPIPIGDNFLNNNSRGGYLGLVDIGIDYNLLKLNNFGIGILINSTVLRFSKNDVTLIILSPKIKVDYKININKISIIPNIAIGYSNWQFRSSAKTFTVENGIPVQIDQAAEFLNGITLKGGTKVVLNSNSRLSWYFQFAYEFTRLEKLDNGIDSNYNRNMHILYPGIGVVWKFNKE
jgi:hypothetical protein